MTQGKFLLARVVIGFLLEIFLRFTGIKVLPTPEDLPKKSV